MSNKYEESGVSLEKGYESVERIKKHISRTNNFGSMSSIGNFGGLFDLSKYQIKKPILVSGTDGVGTKLLIAQEANIHNTIGIDLVAMCVNDVLAVGAQPLFFLDYIAVGKNNPEVIEEIVKGISEGCIISGSALIGGETAEMPDMYHGNHYDLAGYTTGVVDKDNMIDKENVSEGDIIIGLPSSGIHSNGYSLVRKIFFKDHNYNLTQSIKELGCTLQEELLKPTRIYVKGVLDVIKNTEISSIAHITGGGFIENIPRALPDHLGVKITESKIPRLPIFELLERLGEIEHSEMYNIFNMGVGMILILKEKNKEIAMDILSKHDYNPVVIGEVTSKKGVEII
ncbi:Phosphoribosylformylglycinamidine cyclo-ligase [Candidatus Izimaplasma bacterium HR1]|jgi:phosphoribosylformylglycinamidine cyclo-ligase|nr:Phosphoribosylformylglycinamidine cyclo-ligase [Candidatus Izimaplasma bacterium HR1]